jgi:hypothetical protein
VLPQPVLISQVRPDDVRMFENDGNRSIYLGQRSDGWVASQNRLGGLAFLKFLNDEVKPDPGPSDIVAAIPDLDMRIHRQFRH